MLSIPIEDLIFVLCTLVGGGLLLITVLVDDILGGVFDALHIGFDIGGVSLMPLLLGGVFDALHIGFDIGGVSLMPLLLGFVSMFGVGGLFATQVLDLHAGPAAIIAAAGGFIGLGVVFVMFSALRKSEGANPFSTASLVGRPASVAVSIPAGRFGSVLVKAEGQTHEFTATASIDVPAGTQVTVTGTAGTGLIVTPLAPPPTAVTPPAPSTPGEPPASTSGPAGTGGTPDV